MKKYLKLFVFLAILTLSFTLLSCNLSPKQKSKSFAGKWVGKMMMTLVINEDHTWTYGQSIWIFESGTWKEKDDNSIILVKSDGSETVATLDSERYHNDGDAFFSYRDYLEWGWDGDKYYRQDE